MLPMRWQAVQVLSRVAMLRGGGQALKASPMSLAYLPKGSAGRRPVCATKGL